MQQKPNNKQNSDLCIHLNIYVILKTTVCSVISVSEPRRWKKLNNREFYRQITQCPWMEPLSGMNGPLCHFGARRSQPENPSELSHEVRTEDTPWRLADMAEEWAWAEPEPTRGAASRRVPGTAARTRSGQKTVCLSREAVAMCRPWQSPSHLLVFSRLGLSLGLLWVMPLLVLARSVLIYIADVLRTV